MATVNPFDLLVDDDNDDPSHLIALAQKQKEAAAAAAVSTGGKKYPAAAAASAPAKMPTKPVPPSQAVREARNVTNAPARGGGRGGPGRGRGGRGAGIGSNRDFGDGNANGFTGGYGRGGGGVEERDGNRNSERSRGGGHGGPPRQGFRGDRRGGYGNGGEGEEGGDTEHAPRRVYERRSGTGRSYEMKREGAGRGNWGTVTDDVIAQETEENVNVNPDEKVAVPEKQVETEDGTPVEGDKENKDNAANEEEAKPEDKEMTLDEYEKIKEEKRKALLAMKSEERKVSIDKELESMQQLSLKKGNEEIFVKLGSDKGSKRRENADREERVKKSLSINEFLKPAEGEKYGRGRGRGRGDRGPFRGGFGGGPVNTPAAPAIADPGQFPTLGGK